MAASLSLGPTGVGATGLDDASEDSEREIGPFNGTYILRHA